MFICVVAVAALQIILIGIGCICVAIAGVRIFEEPQQVFAICLIVPVLAAFCAGQGEHSKPVCVVGIQIPASVLQARTVRIAAVFQVTGESCVRFLLLRDRDPAVCDGGSDAFQCPVSARFCRNKVNVSVIPVRDQVVLSCLKPVCLDIGDQFRGSDRDRSCSSMAAVHRCRCDRGCTCGNCCHDAVCNSCHIGVAAAPCNGLVGGIGGSDFRSQDTGPSCDQAQRAWSYCNACYRHGIAGFFNSDFIGIGLRPHREQVRGGFLISEILGGGAGRRICALQFAAVDRPVCKRVSGVKHPHVLCIAHHQMAMAGIVSGIIGCMQVPAVQVFDIVPAVGLLKDPADAVVRTVTGDIGDTFESGVRITGAASLRGVRGVDIAQRMSAGDDHIMLNRQSADCDFACVGVAAVHGSDGNSSCAFRHACHQAVRIHCRNCGIAAAPGHALVRRVRGRDRGCQLHGPRGLDRCGVLVQCDACHCGRSCYLCRFVHIQPVIGAVGRIGKVAVAVI